ncbi:biotin transporter BioY [Alicyclobacillus dauci]|uniref:Biotin transporter n=1 Tax=Alicyclobacillus dauci TaxID=1475485 RepID=A0ABY6Z1M1_9BACL|nr:biotin transporter BioY [Alicyclobacillus dauci]WAH36624.1 biotin transporter BioY [Alicyclobacillus dauci]
MRLRGLVFSALFAALFAVISLVQIHVSVIPITLETLIPVIAGGLLGAWYGALTFIIVLGLDVLGLPLIGGHGGVGVLVGPTAGFIWAWPVCAFLTGLLVSRIKSGQRFEYLWIFLAAFIFGDLISYIPGVLWMRHVVPEYRPWGKALMAGMYPFLPGDFIKTLIAALIVERVRKIYPQRRIIHGDRFVGSDSVKPGGIV